MSQPKKPSGANKAPLTRRARNVPKVELELPRPGSEAAFRDALRDVKQASQAADARLVEDALRMADDLAAGVDNATNRDIWTAEYQEARLLANAVLQVSHWTGIAAGRPDPALVHYVRRAMLIGAALERAKLFAKGKGGRQKGDGAHDDVPTFEKALRSLEGPLPPGRKRPLKVTLFVQLAKEHGQKRGDPSRTGPDLQRKYNEWRKTATPEQVALILNQMTCPTCGAKVRADLH